MNEIASVKKQVMEAEWTERIRQCSEGGLTVSEWCREAAFDYYDFTLFPFEICFFYRLKQPPHSK